VQTTKQLLDVQTHCYARGHWLFSRQIRLTQFVDIDSIEDVTYTYEKHSSYFRQLLSEFVKFLLQRRLIRLGLRHLGPYLACSSSSSSTESLQS